MKVVPPKGVLSCSPPMLKHILYMCFSSVRCFTKERNKSFRKRQQEGRELGNGQMGKDGKPRTTADCRQVCLLSEALFPSFPVTQSHNTGQYDWSQAWVLGRNRQGLREESGVLWGTELEQRGRPGSNVEADDSE